MIYEEQASDIIGCFCTLLNPYKGYSDGEVVGDYGNEIVVRPPMAKRWWNTVTM